MPYRKIEHPAGGELNLPCIIPSFTSKGFATLRQEGAGSFSEVDNALQMCSNALGEVVLVSAYDLYYGLLPHASLVFSNDRFVLVDSGGYELSLAFDTTEPMNVPHKPQAFDRDAHLAALRRLPQGGRLIVSNYDWDMSGVDIQDQVENAQDLFLKFPEALHDFLVKPSSKGASLDIHSLGPHVPSLARFDIVGVTENELGNSLREKLMTVAALRALLGTHAEAPAIHVWGGLDPLVTPLFFCAGAEIFDGASWLRYAYIDGLATCRDVYCVLRTGLDTPPDVARAGMLTGNLRELRRLEEGLRRFSESGETDFGLLPWRVDMYRDAWAELKAGIRGAGGGK